MVTVRYLFAGVGAVQPHKEKKIFSLFFLTEDIIKTTRLILCISKFIVLEIELFMSLVQSYKTGL